MCWPTRDIHVKYKIGAIENIKRSKWVYKLNWIFFSNEKGFKIVTGTDTQKPYCIHVFDSSKIFLWQTKNT